MKMRMMRSKMDKSEAEENKKVKTIRCDDLIENVAVSAIICHDYTANKTHIHDL